MSPSEMPKLGKAGSLQSRQAIVHSLVHTESWAIDLSWVLVSGVFCVVVHHFFRCFLFSRQFPCSCYCMDYRSDMDCMEY